MSSTPTAGRSAQYVPTSSMYVAGTGSFALDVIEYARAAGFDVPALIELVDDTRIGTEAHGLPVLAPAALPSDGARAVVGVGGDRLALGSKLIEQGWSAGTVLHPLAAVSPSAAIGAGTVIGPLAVIGAAAVIGEHCLIGRGALIGHHCGLGGGVIVNPGANVGGNTHVGRGAQIGIGATVTNGLRVGADARVAAGAVVLRDVADGVRVQGVPARVYAATGE